MAEKMGKKRHQYLHDLLELMRRAGFAVGSSAHFSTLPIQVGATTPPAGRNCFVLSGLSSAAVQGNEVESG